MAQAIAACGTDGVSWTVSVSAVTDLEDDGGGTVTFTPAIVGTVQVPPETPVAGTVTLEERRGVRIEPLSLDFDEGGTASYTVVLTARPSGTVPGAEYRGLGPDGFMPRDDFGKYLAEWAGRFGCPVRTGVAATGLSQGTNGRLRVDTTDRTPEGPGARCRHRHDAHAAPASACRVGVARLPRAP